MASRCLPPVARPDARVLVLGALPGLTSLHRQQYYAHPRNQFWPIMGGLLHFSPTAPYADRLAHLLANGIALWDVCAEAQRPNTSLDSAIRAAVPNDFPAFLAAHPGIELIACNGATAFNLFQRKVTPQLPASRQALLRQLPSTSPAHGRLTLAAKLQAWSVVCRLS